MVCYANCLGVISEISIKACNINTYFAIYIQCQDIYSNIYKKMGMGKYVIKILKEKIDRQREVEEPYLKTSINPKFNDIQVEQG